jgi:thioredoxin-related protein
MNKILSFSFLLLLSLTLFGQNWYKSIDEAKKVAAENNKTIILVFQGSDWCAPCMKLEKEIWSTEKFKSYALEHFVMLQADFPKRKANQLPKEQQEHNDHLAEQYNLNGYFPHVVVLKADGNVLGRLGYENIRPEEYIKRINNFIAK